MLKGHPGRVFICKMETWADGQEHHKVKGYSFAHGVSNLDLDPIGGPNWAFLLGKGTVVCERVARGRPLIIKRLGR